MTTRTRRTRLLATIAAVAAAVLTPACYTLLQHPRLASLDYARPSSKHCLTCHTEQQLRTLVAGSRHAQTQQAWRSYYDEPWWFGGYLRSDSTTTNDGKQRGATVNQKDGK